MSVFINNLQDELLLGQTEEDMLVSVAEKLLGEHEQPDTAEVSIVFVDDAYIADLNSQYRGVHSPTDVLSFAMQEGDPMPGDENECLLGDVVISLETASRQAQEFGHSMAREVAYLAVHGILHLLGYDHQTEPDQLKMRAAEEDILTREGLVRE